ncbi:nicotinate-nicotinamide nucleotide adenylyltransferase [Clostridium vitabionis]|uniref:nicotinate-nicotinamide nucleotide adenylyltransferase n=1 Tax=Clostridium vitabionis TaxID=2784388 RepID=UPI001F2EC526|nr:cytidyltransferase-related domain protein [Clostridium vitabionis]
MMDAIQEGREKLAQLTEKLAGRSFLRETGISAALVRELLGGEERAAAFARFFPVTGRFCCADIYAFCREAMNRISLEPADGWMKFTYAYACRILFPDPAYAEADRKYGAAARFYLAVMQFLFDEERKALKPEPFYDFVFLDGAEQEKFESREEYRRFLRYFREEYVYEMMRLNAEVTPFRTLEHIAGVHFVAMHVARGLYAAGVPIDLTLISGAAAGHDIGKFGCKPNERVPYLHYYYTNQWFSEREMDYIGHIAANHSTWDLEPEHLSVESLVLIYADFRVKQSRGEDNREITVISSLKDAFDVILHKLDNVDAKKLRRYRFVYARLDDFEQYMRDLGVDTGLDGKTTRPPRMPETTLRNAEDTVKSLVYLGVAHNITVMHRMTAERQFGNFLEAARSEKNWKNLRAYLNIFDEYTAFVNDTQKRQILAFLYELLLHREGQIRAEAAHLMGKILAQFNFGYRKQRPADMPDTDSREALRLWRYYLDRILRPDVKLTGRQQRRIRFCLKTVMRSALDYAGESDFADFFGAFMDCCRDPGSREAGESLVILDSAHDLPLGKMSREDLDTAAAFAAAKADDPDEEVRVAAWRAAKILTGFARGLRAEEEIRRKVRAADMDGSITMTYLGFRILSGLGEDTGREEQALYGADITPSVLLDDLKTATPWIVKAVNIKLLKNQVKYGKFGHRMPIAAHFSNLIKVSEHVTVREDAGAALLEVVPYLRDDERNEVAVELARGLESGEYEFAKYVPRYLGALSLWLPPAQLDEIIDYLESLLTSLNDRIVSGALDTVSVILEHIPAYPERFPLGEEELQKRIVRLFGLLLRGLASYREPVRQEALLAVARIFSSGQISLDRKGEAFRLAYRKLLFYLGMDDPSDITVYYRASALAAIGSFITLWHMDRGRIDIRQREKVAFFPGSFDPFNLSQKEIACRIRDMGFEVLLAVDEFSWSKMTEPHLIRRRIISMSIADEFGVNLFPENIPVNIGNPEDLRRLRGLFGGREVYLVMGTDVVLNASPYRNSGNPDVLAMNHILFRRRGEERGENGFLGDILRQITGKTILLELPERFEEISSPMIRENVDLNRDISHLVAPSVQDYIYSNGLYLREPVDKLMAGGERFLFETYEQPGEELLREIGRRLLGECEEREALLREIACSGDHLMLLRNAQDGGRLAGMIRYRRMDSGGLYTLFGDAGTADRVRRFAQGDVLAIRGLCVSDEAGIADPGQLLLSQVLAAAVAAGTACGIFWGAARAFSGETERLLLRQGFVREVELPPKEGMSPLYLVDMRSPLVLIQNMSTTIKDPLGSSPRVAGALRKAHRALQRSLSGFYPGNLVLSLSAGVIYPELVRKITALNGVPGEPAKPRRLGEAMCVPFGKILRNRVIPNTVTKTLHTDKVYDPAIRKGTIEAFPNYPPLGDQIRMIRSFGRPVILVDDLLHRGGRLEALLPRFAAEHIPIRRVLVGLLSGYGRDVMAGEGVDVDSVYFVPNLRYWLVESTLYPFIGGDTVRRGGAKVAGLAPSINMILPYRRPRIPGVAEEALFAYSACCIRNARDIFLALEEEYRMKFGRNLTLERLTEAVNVPLCPDQGDCMSYDPNLGASAYLENALEMLSRTE